METPILVAAVLEADPSYPYSFSCIIEVKKTRLFGLSVDCCREVFATSKFVMPARLRQGGLCLPDKIRLRPLIADTGFPETAERLSS